MTDPRFSGLDLPNPGFADDDGSADPALAAALASLATGAGHPATVLRALAAARLLVPVVAVLEESETGADGLRHEKSSAMASVTVRAPDGGRSLLAFTSTEALRAWRPDARPIAAATRRVALAALAEGADRLVVDPSGPVPFAVAGAELHGLAVADDPTLPVDEDPQVVAAVAAVCEVEPAVLLAQVAPGDPAGVRVTLVVDDAVPLPEFHALVERVNQGLAASPVLRARAGSVQVVMLPPAAADRMGPGRVVVRRA